MRDYQENVTSRQTDRRMDRWMLDKVIPMCRYALQATKNESCYFIYNKKPLKTIWLDCKANSKLKTHRLTKVNQNADRQTDGHHQSISRNCFAIRPIMVKQLWLRSYYYKYKDYQKVDTNTPFLITLFYSRFFKYICPKIISFAKAI